MVCECRNPLDVFFYHKTLVPMLGIIALIIILCHAITGHPTWTGMYNDIQDGMKFLQESLILGIPNYVWFVLVTIGIIFTNLLLVWNDERDYKYNHWKRWHDLMFGDSMFYHETDGYYYGDVSN